MADDDEMARALRGALDRAEISAWYQPQIDLATGLVVAVEALCRWDRGARGLVPPSRFIPVAEHDGTIAEIGRFMADQAIDAMSEWGIDVSVNVSPRQLEDLVFVTWIERALQRVRRQDRRLTLEITEERHLRDASAIVARLDRLREAGLGVAIDDFGSGHASLTQLRRLHATELKIDRELIADDSPAATEIIVAAITTAHDAGVRVVAEGIETPEQLERVTRLGADRAQGYLLARPMIREECARFLQGPRSDRPRAASH